VEKNMADDERRGDEAEPKITVRDRRRVTAEGELRDVPPEPESTPAAPPAAPAEAAAAPPPPPRSADAPPRRERPRPASPGGRSSALGGADEARVRRDRGGRLRDADAAAADAAGPEGGEADMPPVRDIYDYLTAVTGEMTIWALAALGLVPNPLTRIVATNLDEALFAVDAAERLLELLGEKLEAEEQVALTQNFIVQFASIAAQLLQQPPQVRLQEIQKIRFCIDTADRFLEKLMVLEGESPQTAELTRVVGELKLRFLQTSGGGGIIG
jgi:hypothetical protein